MKSKALILLALAWIAAPTRAETLEKKSRSLHTLIIQEHRVAAFSTDKSGRSDPIPPRPYEIPSDNFAIHEGKNNELIGTQLNLIGEAKKVSSDKVEFGTIELNIKPAEAKKHGGNEPKLKETPIFKPLFTIALPGSDNLVCIYPKPKNDWRGINHLVVPLDAVKPGDKKLLIINTSACPITIRSDDGKAVAIKPSAYAFINRRPHGENKVSIQAAVFIGGQQQLAANTAVTIVPDKLPVLTFVNAEPESGVSGVDFLKDAVDYPPPPEPAGKVFPQK